MKLEKLLSLLDAKTYTSNINLDKKIEYVFSCDLMSDVLMITRDASVEKENIILTTGLATIQSIRTAEMLDVEIICLVRNKVPTEKMISLAEEAGIMLIGTNYSTFMSNGIMYKEGLHGVEGYIAPVQNSK